MVKIDLDLNDIIRKTVIERLGGPLKNNRNAIVVWLHGKILTQNNTYVLLSSSDRISCSWYRLAFGVHVYNDMCFADETEAIKSALSDGGEIYFFDTIFDFAKFLLSNDGEVRK